MTKTESPASDTRPASLADRNDDTRSLTTYLPSEGAPHDVEKAPSSDSSVTQEPQSQDGTPNVECKGPDASDVVDWDSADDPHNPITGPVLENGASLLWSPQSPSSRRLGPLPPKRQFVWLLEERLTSPLQLFCIDSVCSWSTVIDGGVSLDERSSSLFYGLRVHHRLLLGASGAGTHE
ncbi:hypothetical protein GJ744_011304 [Endocarpon pusillum]|uniref:Uncharacterized protein n=1 Tax=Endocarpon pusillum TaxID=364733 RepID=A0A8H7APR0_9EURO|nr:hypothetical protein GJ744_011304 [Endocarpon pusillum]